MSKKNSRSSALDLRSNQSGRTHALSNDFSALVIQDARVFKTGNSLAIRIPSAIAKHIALEDGTVVEMSAASGTIYVRKATEPTLDELIEQITPENLHASAFDELIGAERW